MPTVNACGLNRHWTTPVDVIWGSTTVTIGGGRPVVVQSMTNTATADAEASYRQTAELAEAGSELVRLTVNTPDAARAVVAIREKLDAAGIHVPLVGDFHYNGHKLLTEIPECADCLSKYRINPGNVGKGTKAEENFAMMIEVAKRTGAAVRIGVNGGSLDQALLARLMDENRQSEHPESPQAVLREALVRSAVESAEAAQSLGLPANRLVLSCKVSEVQELIALYRTLSRRTKAALHLGLTEAGIGSKGIVASTAALAVLLEEGIGDTIRVTLTADPVEEIYAAKKILRAAGLRKEGVNLIACPTCGRTRIDLIPVAEEVERRLTNCKKNITVAVMGCAVNGPGEAAAADVGIAGGNGEGLIFRKGEILYKVPQERIVDALMEEIEKL